MPVRVLMLVSGALALLAPITLSIPPPVSFKAVDVKALTKVDPSPHIPKAKTHHPIMADPKHVAKYMAIKSSFVDAMANAKAQMGAGADPKGDAYWEQVIAALHTKVEQLETEVIATKAESDSFRERLHRIEQAEKADEGMAETNAKAGNMVSDAFGGMFTTSEELEEVQQKESAQQGAIGTDAGALITEGAEEGRETDAIDQSREGQKVQLDALTATLFSKIASAEAHHNTLTTWAMQVQFNTNAATAEMEELRGDLLTLDDTMTSVSDDLIELFKDVQGIEHAEV